MEFLIVIAGGLQLALMLFGIWVGLSHVKEMRRQSLFLSEIATKMDKSEGES